MCCNCVQRYPIVFNCVQLCSIMFRAATAARVLCLVPTMRSAAAPGTKATGSAPKACSVFWNTRTRPTRTRPDSRREPSQTRHPTQVRLPAGPTPQPPIQRRTYDGLNHGLMPCHGRLGHRIGNVMTDTTCTMMNAATDARIQSLGLVSTRSSHKRSGTAHR